MSDALFDLLDFAPPAPDWAVACWYCSPDGTGAYDEARHLWSHLALTCSVCGEASPNRLLFDMSHTITLGGSWGRNALVCTSLDLQLNHLSYDILHGEEPSERDLTPLRLGWLLGPEGSAVPPDGWPDGSRAVRCEAVPKLADSETGGNRG